MAIAFVNSSTNSSATGTAASVSAPAGVSSGDLLIFVVHGNGGTNSVADNNGGTATTDGYSAVWVGSAYTAVRYRIAGNSEPSTYNFTMGVSDRWNISCAAYSGVDNSSPFDVAPASGNRTDTLTSTTATAPTVTSSTTDAWAIAIACIDAATAITFTATPSGYNSRTNYTGTGSTTALVDKVLTGTSISSGTAAWTLSGSNAWLAQQFIIRAAAAVVLKPSTAMMMGI